MENILKLVKREQREVFELMLGSLKNNGIIPVVIVDSDSVTIEGGDENKVFELEPQIAFEFQNEKARFAFEHLLLEKEVCLVLLEKFEEQAYSIGYEASDLFFKVEFSTAYNFELKISICNRYGVIDSTNAHYYTKTSGAKNKDLNQKIEEFLSM